MAEQQGSAETELLARVREPKLELEAIAQLLDSLSGSERVRAIRSLKSADQRHLYDAVEGFAPVRLIELVPREVAELTAVRHFGKNSLPVFREFEKRFARAPGMDPEHPKELMGFNFQVMAPLTGPGYFIAVEDEARGEVLIDYRRVPDRHPVDWPEIRINEKGISRFVYGFMVDTLRRVSAHVTIGSAARHGRDTGNWFVLCRES